MIMYNDYKFVYNYVYEPQRFGIVEFNKDGKVISVEENPRTPNQIIALPDFISMIIAFLGMQKK